MDMELWTGDLLFLELADRPLAEAISDVTQRQFGVTNLPLSHVGLALLESDGWKVYESWDQVQLTPLKEFREKGRQVWHARLKPEWRYLIPKAIEALHRRRGKSYDHDYRNDSEDYYCSHLIAEAFREANGGPPLFEYRPMYFGEPGDESWKMWEAHFQNRGQEIPVGEPGISPLGIYLSKFLDKL
jgi:hypothetical protein